MNGSRIDMNLLYKYSKPSPLGMSQLRFLVNDHLLRSYPLKPENESDVITENMPLLGTLNLFTKSKVETSFLKPMNKLTLILITQCSTPQRLTSVLLSYLFQIV